MTPKINQDTGRRLNNALVFHDIQGKF